MEILQIDRTSSDRQLLTSEPERNLVCGVKLKPDDRATERPMNFRNGLSDEPLFRGKPALLMPQNGLLGKLKKALLNRLMAAVFERRLGQ